MTIYRRTKTGWTDRLENKSQTHCDICKDRLWVNPDGEPYCNGNWKACTPKASL